MRLRFGSELLCVLVLVGFSGPAFAQAVEVEVQAEVEAPPDPFVDDAPPPPPPPAPSGYPGQEPAPPPQQPPPPPGPIVQAQPYVMPTAEREHRGFFLRFIIGGNFLGMRTDVGGSDVTIRGGGVAGAFSIGFSVIPRLAIHFDTYVAAALQPSVDFAGMSGNADSLVLFSIGGGATYYLPNNMYFSIGVGFGAAALANASGSSLGSTEGGVTARFLIGKEWWMGTEWGIGVAGILGFARLPDGPADWTAGHIGIGLSLTKN